MAYSAATSCRSTGRAALLPFDSAGRIPGLLVAAFVQHRLGPASLVIYDVSTLYFETDAGDGFRGNTAGTTTMVPTIQAVMTCALIGTSGRLTLRRPATLRDARSAADQYTWPSSTPSHR